MSFEAVVTSVDMRFTMLDKITDLQPGSRITAAKTLSPSDEYLRDHFPRFPVMPGVLMLEAMYEACAWLIRKSEDFGHALVLLKEARNVKYADFVGPGETLVVTAEIVKQDDASTTLKARGEVGGVVAVSGTLVMERSHICDLHPQRAAWDLYSHRKYREEFQRLYQPQP